MLILNWLFRIVFVDFFFQIAAYLVQLTQIFLLFVELISLIFRLFKKSENFSKKNL